MRVLHVIPSVADRYGGPSAAVRGMTAALAARGLAVTVASTDADGPSRLDVPLDVPTMRDGVTYRFFSRTLPGEYKFSLPLAGWLRESLASFDVVHVHALFSFSTIPACRTAARVGVPYVIRPLGTLGAWSLSHSGWKKAPYLALVERRHLRHAAALHATSVGEADALAALGYRSKTRVIPLGVELGEGGPGAPGPVPAPAASSGREPFRVLFLSRLHPVKNLPLLLEAVARSRSIASRPIHLTVVGDGPEPYVRELRERAAALGVSAYVHFVGPLAGEEKRAAFAAADLFALPSSHENFGIAAAEALGRGVPVLLSSEVGIAADVARAGAGVIVTRDATAISEALARLADAPAALVPMRRAALALAGERYSWAGSAESLEALYSELCRGGPRGGMAARG